MDTTMLDADKHSLRQLSYSKQQNHTEQERCQL